MSEQVKEEMLVTQALNELKTLDSRINKAITNAIFVGVAKEKDENVTPGVTKDRFVENAKSAYSSVNDLISRREKIKKAVLASNAKTYIELCNKDVTVAEAIDMKNSIAYHKGLLQLMKRQNDNAKSKVNSNNLLMEEKLDNMLLAAVGKDGKNNNNQEQEFKNIIKSITDSNKYTLVDPLNIEKKIKELEEYIETFESEVDAKLQVSNCTTYIII